MESSDAMADRPGREVAFEPLLDRLAEIFEPDRAPWRPWPDGHQPNWYERCETKRLAVARAAALDVGKVRAHADLVLRAIAHDTDPSGNRQLIQVALRALGARAVLAALIEFVESGDEAEQCGAAAAMYWAHPAVAYDNSREMHERRGEIEAESAELAELRSRARQACLCAFLATDDPSLRAELSRRFTLNPAGYPSGWEARLTRAFDIAVADRGRYDRLLRTLPLGSGSEPESEPGARHS